MEFCQVDEWHQPQARCLAEPSSAAVMITKPNCICFCTVKKRRFSNDGYWSSDWCQYRGIHLVATDTKSAGPLIASSHSRLLSLNDSSDYIMLISWHGLISGKNSTEECWNCKDHIMTVWGSLGCSDTFGPIYDITKCFVLVWSSWLCGSLLLPFCQARITYS